MNLLDFWKNRVAQERGRIMISFFFPRWCPERSTRFWTRRVLMNMIFERNFCGIILRNNKLESMIQVLFDGRRGIFLVIVRVRINFYFEFEITAGKFFFGIFLSFYGNIVLLKWQEFNSKFKKRQKKIGIFSFLLGYSKKLTTVFLVINLSLNITIFRFDRKMNDWTFNPDSEEGKKLLDMNAGEIWEEIWKKKITTRGASLMKKELEEGIMAKKISNLSGEISVSRVVVNQVCIDSFNLIIFIGKIIDHKLKKENARKIENYTNETNLKKKEKLLNEIRLHEALGYQIKERFDTKCLIEFWLTKYFGTPVNIESTQTELSLGQIRIIYPLDKQKHVRKMIMQNKRMNLIDERQEVIEKLSFITGVYAGDIKDFNKCDSLKEKWTEVKYSEDRLCFWPSEKEMELVKDLKFNCNGKSKKKLNKRQLLNMLVGKIFSLSVVDKILAIRTREPRYDVKAGKYLINKYRFQVVVSDKVDEKDRLELIGSLLRGLFEIIRIRSYKDEERTNSRKRKREEERDKKLKEEKRIKKRKFVLSPSIF